MSTDNVAKISPVEEEGSQMLGMNRTAWQSANFCLQMPGLSINLFWFGAAHAHLHAHRERNRHREGEETADYLQDIGSSKSMMKRPDPDASLSWR